MVPAAKTLQVGGCFLRVLAHERQPCKSTAATRINAIQMQACAWMILRLIMGNSLATSEGRAWSCHALHVRGTAAWSSQKQPWTPCCLQMLQIRKRTTSLSLCCRLHGAQRVTMQWGSTTDSRHLQLPVQQTCLPRQQRRQRRLSPSSSHLGSRGLTSPLCPPSWCLTTCGTTCPAWSACTRSDTLLQIQCTSSGLPVIASSGSLRRVLFV